MSLEGANCTRVTQDEEKKTPFQDFLSPLICRTEVQVFGLLSAGPAARRHLKWWMSDGGNDGGSEPSWRRTSACVQASRTTRTAVTTWPVCILWDAALRRDRRHQNNRTHTFVSEYRHHHRHHRRSTMGVKQKSLRFWSLPWAYLNNEQRDNHIPFPLCGVFSLITICFDMATNPFDPVQISALRQLCWAI